MQNIRNFSNTAVAIVGALAAPHAAHLVEQKSVVVGGGGVDFSSSSLPGPGLQEAQGLRLRRFSPETNRKVGKYWKVVAAVVGAAGLAVGAIAGVIDVGDGQSLGEAMLGKGEETVHLEVPLDSGDTVKYTEVDGKPYWTWSGSAATATGKAATDAVAADPSAVKVLSSGFSSAFAEVTQ